MEHYLALHASLARCGSPVEVRFALALLASPDRFTFAPRGGRWVDALGVELLQQHTIGPYRVDFVFMPLRVVVELDGYAFHDATPALAERDKRRDRFIVARGWRVVRFAAREVRRDALACAVEAYAFARGGLVPLPGRRPSEQLPFAFDR